MPSFTFLHAADLHLDSPLRGLDDAAPTARIRDATRQALVNLVTLAIERKVAFVLLAGDLYDGDWKDWRTGQFLVQQLARLTAESIEGATKLLKLTVDIGEETPRQILAGIAESYAPEDLPGRKIVVVANLAPRKMRGLESHGMLLAASEEGGKPFLATVPEGVPLGSRLK